MFNIPLDDTEELVDTFYNNDKTRIKGAIIRTKSNNQEEPMPENNPTNITTMDMMLAEILLDQAKILNRLKEMEKKE